MRSITWTQTGGNRHRVVIDDRSQTQRLGDSLAALAQQNVASQQAGQAQVLWHMPFGASQAQRLLSLPPGASMFGRGFP